MYPHQLGLVTSLLESEGIDFLVYDEFTTSVHNFYSQAIGGIKIMVLNEDFEKAQKILVEKEYLSDSHTEAMEIENNINKTSVLNLIGKTPIPSIWFYTIKTALFATILSPFIFQPTQNLYLSMGFIVLGFVILVVGILNMGRSISLGLPTVETRLKTKGLYQISRNPIYIAYFMMALGSCLWVMHFVPWVLFTFALIAHHFIVLAEERFLASRFGNAWDEYAARVPRYLFF